MLRGKIVLKKTLKEMKHFNITLGICLFNSLNLSTKYVARLHKFQNFIYVYIHNSDISIQMQYFSSNRYKFHCCSTYYDITRRFSMSYFLAEKHHVKKSSHTSSIFMWHYHWKMTLYFWRDHFTATLLGKYFIFPSQKYNFSYIRKTNLYTKLLWIKFFFEHVSRTKWKYFW